METSLLHTSAIINDVNNARVLVDNGASCYAAVSPKAARHWKLELIPIEPRTIDGVFEDAQAQVSNVARFSMDLSGHRMTTMFAYVLPGQHEDLLLGRAFLRDQEAVIDEGKHTLHFKFSGITIHDEDTSKARTTLQVNMVSASTIAALARRARKNGTGKTAIFSASLQDIEKALAPKKSFTIKEIISMLPTEYKDFAKFFSSIAAKTLPPHRPGIDHEIPIEGDKEPPWGPLYAMSREELLVLRKTLTELLDAGFIRASRSAAAAPVLFVKKPGGGLRFCVDYRNLNSITSKDRYPLPLIKETLNALSKAKWLTKLDVSAAFHRIRIAKGEEWKTAFRTRFGLFEWLVTPFGLHGAPATFQRYINHVLREYLDVFCTAYVDDILIYSSGSLKEHREQVRTVLGKLQEAGLQCDISKCEFEVKKVKYLGYIIEAGVGVCMDPEKIKAIKEWEAPSGVRGVRSFLGFANYYRDFIKNYSELARPLTALTKKDTPFTWGYQEQSAFDMLKRKFLEDPLLATFDPDRPTRLEADSSGWSAGGLMSQKNPDTGLWHPCAYFSQKHTPAECNYDIHDKEMLAIVKCLKHWKAELLSVKGFTILTDHKNLEPFMTKRALTEKQVRWSQVIAPFNFKLDHRPGARAPAPDALSRREQDLPQDDRDSRVVEREQTLLPPTLWINCTMTTAAEPPFDLDQEELRTQWNKAMETEAGKAYDQAIKAVRDGEARFPPDLHLHVSISDCEIDKGILKYRGRTWLPSYEPLTTRVIQAIHDSALGGHPGRDVTNALIRREFFWPNQGQDVRKFVRNCDICGRTTIWRDKKHGLLKPLPVPDRIWQEIAMDHIIDLPPSWGCEAILVIKDRLGKGCMLIAVPKDKFDAEGTAGLFLRHYISQHWLPRAITSDRGTQFVNAFWKQLTADLGVKQRLSTAYHPETDGATERTNQELETYIRAFVAYAQDDWARLLPLAQVSLNNRPAAATGMSPFFLQHGYNAVLLPFSDNDLTMNTRSNPAASAQRLVQKLKEATEWAQAAMATAQENMERTVNRGRQPAPAYKVGDKVWLNLKNIHTKRPCKKFDWLHAKYTVTKVFGSHTYELDVPHSIFNRFHPSLLRPAATNALPSQVRDDTQPPAIFSDDGDPEFGVEKILCAKWVGRGRGRTRKVFVKWTGYAEPTWEPLREMQETTALDAFEAQYGDAMVNDGPLATYDHPRPHRKPTSLREEGGDVTGQRRVVRPGLRHQPARRN